MKTIGLLMLALAVLSPSYAANVLWDSKAKEAFIQERAEKHPWTKGSALPRSLTEAGLLEDAKLVWSDMYLDGGTRGYLFRDSSGKYLAFCTGPGLQSSQDFPGRIDAPPHSRLFIGSLHYTHAEALMVDGGSECEEFLRSLIEKNSG